MISNSWKLFKIKFVILVVMLIVAAILLHPVLRDDNDSNWDYLGFDLITFEDMVSCGDGTYLETTNLIPVCPHCKKGTLRWFEDTKVFEIENYDVDGTYYNNWVRVDVYRCSDCNSVYYVEKYQDKKKYVENIDTVKNWIEQLKVGE